MEKIISVDELKKKKKHLSRLANKEVMLVFKNGKIHAFSGFCPHQGGPLIEGDIIDSKLRCPWHGCVFELDSGLCVDTGNCKNLSKEDVFLERIKYVVKDGEVYIDG